MMCLQTVLPLTAKTLGARFGTTGSDTLIGAQTDDVSMGAEGNDYMEGAATNDVLDARGGNDLVYGGEGNDSLILTGLTAGTSYTLQDTIENLGLLGSVGITARGNVSANYIDGTGGDDNIYGLDGDDTLTGNSGNDSLSGEIGRAHV